jgi:hypothetical protein
MAQEIDPVTNNALLNVRQAAHIYSQVGGDRDDRSDVLGKIAVVVHAVLDDGSSAGDVARASEALADLVDAKRIRDQEAARD